jgi:hypothetical protein
VPHELLSWTQVGRRPTHRSVHLQALRNGVRERRGAAHESNTEQLGVESPTTRTDTQRASLASSGHGYNTSGAAVPTARGGEDGASVACGLSDDAMAPLRSASAGTKPGDPHRPDWCDHPGRSIGAQAQSSQAHQEAPSRAAHVSKAAGSHASSSRAGPAERSDAVPTKRHSADVAETETDTPQCVRAATRKLANQESAEEATAKAKDALRAGASAMAP